jgi:cytochrome c553
MKKLFLWLSLMAIGMVIAICVPLLASPSPHQEYPVGSPPFTEGIFPCSNCHAGLETNAKRRELKDEHTSIKLRHAEQERWCLDCHNAANRDKLKLADGETIAFTESYRLCGQCHGNIYKDWKAGIHGKRVGYFKGGKRTYFLCVNCHNPHDPAFKPLPPPVRPELNNGR